MDISYKGMHIFIIDWFSLTMDGKFDIYPSWMNVINAFMNGYHHYVKMKSIHPYMNDIHQPWVDGCIH
jgi:hypothetical protein